VSLSVPYVLSAAAVTVSDATVGVAGRLITCAELERRTRNQAELLLAAGYRPGQAFHAPMAGFEALIRALAALRVGLRLTRSQGPQLIRTGGCPTSRSLTTLWSDTPAVELEAPARAVMTQGALLALAGSPSGSVEAPEWLDGLVQVLAAVLAADISRDTPPDRNCSASG